MAGVPAKKNAAFTLVFPIYDADGDLVTGAANLDSERSLDGANFADCTNEASEIGVASGMYKLVLTAAEMNADVIATITKTSTADAKTAANVLYTSTRQIDDLAFPATSGRSLGVEADGHVHADLKQWLGVAPLALLAQRVQTSVGAMAADVITAAVIAAGAITAAEAPNLDAAVSSRSSHNAAAIWAVAVRNLTALGFNLANTDFAAGAIDAAAIAAAAITAVEAPNLDAAVSSRSSHTAANVWAVGARTLTALGFQLNTGDFVAGYLTAALIAANAIGAAEFDQAAADKIWASAARTLTALGFNLANTDFAANALDAAALATDAAEEIADALIGRNIAGGSNVGRTIDEALAMLRNRRRIVAGIMTVYQADDATPLWTAGVATAPGNPVTDIDPV